MKSFTLMLNVLQLHFATNTALIPQAPAPRGSPNTEFSPMISLHKHNICIKTYLLSFGKIIPVNSGSHPLLSTRMMHSPILCGSITSTRPFIITSTLSAGVCSSKMVVPAAKYFISPRRTSWSQPSLSSKSLNLN